jgi:hypothetical protein
MNNKDFKFLVADNALNITATGINTTPLTEEILIEAMEKIERFKKKENMQKLLREFLEAIEKNNIKEVLFFNAPYKEKD